MHFALLIGYGASAINPYLALETLESLARRGDLPEGMTAELAVKHFIKAINKGLLKTFSKMGISTLQSYRGAQVFEAIGLNKESGRCIFRRHHVAPGRRRSRRAGARSADEARARVPSADGIRNRACSRRQLSLPRQRRISPAESADHQQAAACGAAGKLQDIPGIHRPHRQAEQQPGDPAQPDEDQEERRSRFRSRKSSLPKKS